MVRDFVLVGENDTSHLLDHAEIDARSSFICVAESVRLSTAMKRQVSSANRRICDL